MLRWTSIIAATAMVAGCVSIGPNYDPAAVDRLQAGMDTAQVIAILGRPTTTVTLADGRQQLMWIHSRGDMLGRAEARTVTLMFNADGKYVSRGIQAEFNIR